MPVIDPNEPCPACPVLVRGLSATVHNALGEWERITNGNGDWPRFHRKMAALKDSLESFQPIVDAHFSNPEHSHGDSLKEARG